MTANPTQLSLPLLGPKNSAVDALHDALRSFDEFGAASQVESMELPGGSTLPVYRNEFWTSRQRAASALHEVSYRACFKPQLPRFFIERLTQPGERVHDPFMGRGTTPLETALLDRIPCGGDINPLSTRLISPRFAPPSLAEIKNRLADIPFSAEIEYPEDLLVFYHPETLQQICALRRWCHKRDLAGELDGIDSWIRMVATNRLTGHSPGFFSVYTLPPNQAVSLVSQRKINTKRKQTPPVRDVSALILRKSRALLKTKTPKEHEALVRRGDQGLLLTSSANAAPAIEDESVALVVTSPPFLNVVDYATDNWLRCWFHHIDPRAVPLWQLKNPRDWQEHMTGVLREMRRIVQPGGWVAFEVGEVLKGKLLLEELVVPAGMDAGLYPELLLINQQNFTKTAHCWGVSNQSKGTNTNRIILLRKPS